MRCSRHAVTPCARPVADSTHFRALPAAGYLPVTARRPGRSGAGRGVIRTARPAGGTIGRIAPSPPCRWPALRSGCPRPATRPRTTSCAGLGMVSGRTGGIGGSSRPCRRRGAAAAQAAVLPAPPAVQDHHRTGVPNLAGHPAQRQQQRDHGQYRQPEHQPPPWIEVVHAHTYGSSPAVVASDRLIIDMNRVSPPRPSVRHHAQPRCPGDDSGNIARTQALDAAPHSGCANSGSDTRAATTAARELSYQMTCTVLVRAIARSAGTSGKRS